MNIVLVNPPPRKIVEVYDKPDYPHVGLGYLASNLELNGFSPIVIDAKLEGISFEETIEKVLSLSPAVLGVTAMTHEITYAHELVTHLKEKGCEATTLVGGVHVTAIPERTLEEFPSFDIGVIAEGEHAIVELCDSIIRKKINFKNVPGIVYRDNEKKVRLSSSRPFCRDLDTLPFPAWHLFPVTKEYPILTARGCPANCIFCAHSYGYAIRERSPSNILKEWKKTVTTYTPGKMRMLDETFAFNKERAVAFLNMIIESKLIVPWTGFTRVTAASQDLMYKMKESGCNTVGVGVETGDPDILKKIGKGTTLEQAKLAVKYINNANMRSSVYFILGQPNETMQTMWKTIKFAASLKATNVVLGIMVPYPGTKVASMAAKGEGGYKILSNNWEDYNKQIGNAVELENLSRKTIELFQLFGYLYFYLANGRIMDTLRFILKYKSQAIGYSQNFFKLRRSNKDVLKTRKTCQNT